MKRLALAAGLALTVAAVAPSGATAKPKKSTCKLTKPPASVATGMSVPFKGKVSPKAARKVSVQAKVGRKWVTRGKGKSSRKGAFNVSVKLSDAGATKWRVSVTKTSKYKSATCKSVTVTVTTGTGSTDMGGDMPGGTGTGPGTPGGGGSPPPDPGTGGPQAGNSFRAIYAVASDEAPIAGRPAAIVANIKAVNGWYATQTTGNVQPRWIRDSAGEPIVTTVNLPNPVSYYDGMDVLTRLRNDVNAIAPPAAPTQKTVIWTTGGGAVPGCGITGGSISVLFSARCGIDPAAGDTWPFGATYLLGHEMTHNFGAVPSCAPHEGGGAHVTDDPRDVLYQGPQPRDWNNQMLDPGHDDYYATGRADCPGIETSPFWTMTADPAS